MTLFEKERQFCLSQRRESGEPDPRQRIVLTLNLREKPHKDLHI